MPVQLLTGTGVDQNSQTAGFTGQVIALNETATLTTTWQRFSYTATLASNISEIATVFNYVPVGTAGAADYYEITGVQLEAGSTATAFKRNASNIQGELAACQRYYVRENYTVVSGNQKNGVGVSGTLADTFWQLPVTMRIAPTSIEYSGVQMWNYSSGGGYTTVTCTLASFTSDKTAVIRYQHGSSVFTAATNYGLAASATNGYVGISAEL